MFKKILELGLIGIVGATVVCSNCGHKINIQDKLDAEYEKAQNELVYEHIELQNTEEMIINTSETHHDDLKVIAEQKGLTQFKKAIYTFSNGSTLVAYPQLEKWYFTPYEMGDWDYELTSEKDAENIVKCYISMKGTGTF